MSSESSCDEFERKRTNSGSVITWNTKDLRTFFSAEGPKKIGESEQSEQTGLKVNQLRRTPKRKCKFTQPERDSALKKYKQRVLKRTTRQVRSTSGADQSKQVKCFPLDVSSQSEYTDCSDSEVTEPERELLSFLSSVTSAKKEKVSLNKKVEQKG